MKRILTILCVLAIVMAGSAALAAEPEAGQSANFYPIAVEEYMEGESPRIRKVYQLSLSDDPSAISTEDFERDGQRYRLLDLIRKDEIGVDTRPHTQTVTFPSDTNDLETILQRLDAEMETTTEDGYSGTLHLDHTTVQVTADGYATKTSAISATRTYPNLSDADLSLIPKTIEEKGKTLSLADVQWSNSTQTEAEGAVVRWCAAASYTGTASSKYATGYTATADYTGEVSKTGCNVVCYTAIFGSVEVPESPADVAESNPPEETPAPEGTEAAGFVRPLLIGGGVLAAAIGGAFAFKKLKRR